VRVLKRLLALPRHGRALGVCRAICRQSPQEDRPVSTESQELLQQLAAAGQSGGTSRRIVLCEQSLQLVDKETQPRLWAALHAEMSDCLTDCPEGERRENLEQAIGHCKRALTVFTRRSFPTEWAMTQTN